MGRGGGVRVVPRYRLVVCSRGKKFHQAEGEYLRVAVELTDVLSLDPGVRRGVYVSLNTRQTGALQLVSPGEESL